MEFGSKVCVSGIGPHLCVCYFVTFPIAVTELDKKQLKGGRVC